MLMLTMPVRAQTTQDMLAEQLDASGAGELYDTLPQETRSLLSELGIDAFTLEAIMAMQPQTVFSAFSDLLYQEAAAPFTAAVFMLGTMLLLGFFSTLQPALNERMPFVRVIGTLVATAPLLIPLWQTMQRVQAATDSASIFMIGFAPVYAGVLAAQGSAAAAVSYQTVMLAAAQGIGALVSNMLVPLLAVALALGIGGAMNDRLRLGDASALVHRVGIWLLGISLTVFVGMLSLRGVLSACADSVTGRALRFSVSGFIPIVGGSLAEALYTVRGCLAALKGSIGGFGILATVLIVLPTLIECIVWNLLLLLTKTTAQLFSLSEVAAVSESAARIIKALIAVLASSSVLMIVSVTLVTLAGGGAL